MDGTTTFADSMIGGQSEVLKAPEVDYRSIDYHKKMNLKKKALAPSSEQPLDSLQLLWKMLDEQDDELITQDSCQIQKTSPVLYDYAPEIHTTA